MYAIYGLIDPRDRLVFYVGQTTDVYKRFIEHINCASNNFERNSRIHELRALNLMVIMEVFELVEVKSIANDREAYWVSHFERIQHPLTNISLMSAPKKTRRDQLKRAMSLSAQLAQYEANPDSLKPISVPEQKEMSFDAMVAAWNDGNTTARKLAAALSTPGHHVGKDKALHIIREMKARGLV